MAESRVDPHAAPAVDPSRIAWAGVQARLRAFIARRVDPSDVDDVLQEVPMRAVRGVSSLRDDERLTSWLYAAARNAITDHRRRAGRRRALELGEHPDESAQAGVEEDDDVYTGAASCIASMVALLPSPYREALAMTELEGMSQREAADRLGISYSGLRSRVQRAREQLRDHVRACCTIELDARRRVVDCRSSPSGCGGDGCGST